MRARRHAYGASDDPDPLEGPYFGRPTNRAAVAALGITIINMVFGTLSLLLGPVISLGISLSGIICGHLALRRVRLTGESGKAIAILALVVNYSALIFVSSAVMLLVFFTGLARILAGFWPGM